MDHRKINFHARSIFDEVSKNILSSQTRAEGCSSEAVGWNDAHWLFPKAVQILEVELYRKSVLLGLITSVGSLTDSTVRMSKMHFTLRLLMPRTQASSRLSEFGIICARATPTTNAISEL